MGFESGRRRRTPTALEVCIHRSFSCNSPHILARDPPLVSDSHPGMDTAAIVPAGVNLIGHVTADMGLGVAARNTLTTLLAHDCPVAAIDIDPGGGRRNADVTFSHLLTTSPAAPHPINLFHLNPAQLIVLLDSRPRWLDMPQRVNAIVPFWELPLLPMVPDWAGVLGATDIVLAPSRSIFEAIKRSAPAVHAVHYPQTVFLPTGVAACRETFGLPRDAVLFFMNIDVSSDLARKNPAAALAAFRVAFPLAENVSLVVKLSHSRTRMPWADPTDLLAELAGMPNTVVIDRQLSYVETLSLSAACDVYVSLHRAEGLGLNLLEAMSLGKPVIATDWSGNMDFMSRDDACLVGHDLVPVRARHVAYRPEAIGPGQVWAEPRIAEAAAWMRRLADDASLRRRIGDAARTAMDARRSDVLQGGVLADLSQAAAAFQPGHSAARRMRWQRLRTPPATRAWKLATRVARRLRRVMLG